MAELTSPLPSFLSALARPPPLCISLLSTRGLLVHPDPRLQTLIVLLPAALHNEKGIKVGRNARG